MALTLTEERRVAWKIQGVGPDPAHTLVIFKKVGMGKNLHKILNPGQSFRRSLFESVGSYETFVISADKNLRHEFSRKYEGSSQAWTFTLHIDLYFQVSSAEKLALKLMGDDPLRRLENEVAKVLSTTARQLSWETMKQEGDHFCSHLRKAESANGNGEMVTNFTRIKEFAEDLGFDLYDIGVTRSLTEVDLAGERERWSNSRTEEVEKSKQELELQRKKRLHELEALEGKLRLERDIFLARQSQSLEAMGRLKMMLDGIAREGARGLSQAVDGLRSFKDIKEAIDEVRGIKASLAELFEGQGHHSARPEIAETDRQVITSYLVEELAENHRDPVERLLAKAFKHLRILDDNLGDKRRILAATLHIVAEASLGEEGDEEYLEGCRENLKQQLYPLESALEEEQLGFLRRIMDIEKLRQELR